MANRMEHHKTENFEYACVCGKGSYTLKWHTYRDDYFNEDIKSEGKIDCPICRETHQLNGYSLVPLEMTHKVREVTEAVRNMCQLIRQYSLSRYREEMFQYVTSIPVVQWHRLWKVGSPAIGTFRKDLKTPDGQRNTFNHLLSGNYESNINRIFATLEKCEIEDQQLTSWEYDLQKLIENKLVVKDQESKALFNGKLLRKYDSYVDPK
nr:hypothetical protein [Paenibacillus xylanexedens]